LCDVDEPYASLPAVPPGRARAPRSNCRLFDTGRRNPARDGLFAGRKRDSNLRSLLAKKPLSLRGRVAERSNGQSRKAVPDRGPRGRIPLLPPTGHGSNPFSRNRLAGQKNGARLGENRAPVCQKRLGKSDAVGEKGPVSERTVVLAAPEATLAGEEPSKVGSETTQIHRWRSALAETLLCLGGSVR
jgi:hypothetical protein